MRLYFDGNGGITPIPDEVKIVRCKDCKWRYTNACFCKAPNDVRDDWFCSEGEMKQDEHDVSVPEKYWDKMRQT